MKKIIFSILTIIVVICGIQACKTYYFRSAYYDENSLLHGTENLETKPFLKAHLKNGDVCILKDTWAVDITKNIVIGNGEQFDLNRKLKYQGPFSIPTDSVAIFETNTKITNSENARLAALSLLVGMDIAVGIICLSNPKACFGSCPTFYLNEHDNFHYADAEGFSNAISPSMEYSDIDAINQKRLNGNTLSITMKNEALETHCVNDVKILAYPLGKGERVYLSPADDFYLCENNYSLSSARANESNITTLLKNRDRQEWFSLSDADNLCSKEAVYLTFDNVERTEDLGLVIDFRQTLMTTYLFYSAMGYMGDHVSEVFATLETDEKMRDRFDATTELLGGIDCYVWNERTNAFELQAEVSETDPLPSTGRLFHLIMCR